MTKGWTRKVLAGKRGETKPAPIAADRRADGTNNGVWVHSRAPVVAERGHGDLLKDLVDRRSFDELLKDVRAGAEVARGVAEVACSRGPGFKVELVAAEPLVRTRSPSPGGRTASSGSSRWATIRSASTARASPAAASSSSKTPTATASTTRRRSSSTTSAIPTGVMPWRKGVLVTCAPDIFYAEDTDGDGKADKREVALHRLRARATSSTASTASSGASTTGSTAPTATAAARSSRSRPARTVNIRGRDFRIRPDTGEIEPQTGQTQFGRSRDDWGNWFGSNNTNPMWHYVLDDHYLRRNPHVAPPDARVHGLGDARRVAGLSRSAARCRASTTSTRPTASPSACSPIIYRDELFGPEFAGNVVHQRAGAQPRPSRGHDAQGRDLHQPPRGRRAAESEFLASSDNWFRPTMIQTGPDGALWIADMYRHVIEHPEWIPQDWQKRLDLRAGHDKGRIYRVYPVGHEAAADPAARQARHRRAWSPRSTAPAAGSATWPSRC